MKTAAALLVALALSACATFGSHTASLPVGGDPRQVIRDAVHVLGQPTREGTITMKADGTKLDVIIWEREGTKDVALMFYNGQFIQLASATAGEIDPVREDFKDIDNRKEGPDVYLLESKKDGSVEYKAINRKR